MSWKPDSYTSTFLTNNLNLAAAVAAIEVLRERAAGRARGGDRSRRPLPSCAAGWKA